jgi:ankyrin repeat protein
MMKLEFGLSSKYNFIFDPNIRSSLQATPLHFAVIFKEIKNVELLIKMEADLNA